MVSKYEECKIIVCTTRDTMKAEIAAAKEAELSLYMTKYAGMFSGVNANTTDKELGAIMFECRKAEYIANKAIKAEPATKQESVKDMMARIKAANGSLI
jgi:hypothetical protein